MGKFWDQILYLKPRVGNVSDKAMLIHVLLYISVKYKFLVVMKPKEKGKGHPITGHEGPTGVVEV
jgi:hypothetical protein